MKMNAKKTHAKRQTGASDLARPNFVFILADDLGYADLHCYGGREDCSPNLDKIAAEGLLFTNGYANSCVCSSSRFAIATGRYQHRLRGGFDEPIASASPKLGLPPVHPTMASLLGDAGYRTALVGKWHMVNNRNADEAAERIQKITGPRGAGLVLDCVGVQPTVDLGAKLLGRNSVWTVVGLGGGHHDFHHGSTPYGTLMSIPYWGSRVELMEVIAMARDGRIHAETTEFPLEQAVEVYGQLKAGQITGRAVLIPGGA